MKWTALHAAGNGNSGECAQLLLDAGLDPAIKDKVKIKEYEIVKESMRLIKITGDY